ncbi:MAG: hypothetical protein K0R58_3108 [Ramlibacter sp.]|nr:hypothetical protein [Ramlibacter sp.]
MRYRNPFCEPEGAMASDGSAGSEPGGADRAGAYRGFFAIRKSTDPDPATKASTVKPMR